jgi:hypothetical protein
MKVRDITKAGTSLSLVVYHGTKKLGTLTIGQGSLRWKTRRRGFQMLRWTQFAEFMDELRRD